MFIGSIRAASGVVAISLAALVALPIAPSALAAPDAGSSGSASGSLASGSGGASSGGGSVSSGSTIPGPLQNERPPLPSLRDGITSAAIVGEERKSDQLVRFTVASPALRRNVGVEVALPLDNSVPRPSIYALEGVDAGEDTSGWVTMGGVPKFFADKNVNVVMVNGGVSGMYTDWDRPDPGVGLHKWETFITGELPPLMDSRLKTNGVKSLMGASMGAQGAMMLAHRHPDMYRGIAAFSGCYSTTDDLGRLSVLATVSSRGGDPANVWGDFAGPGWVAHDSLRHAEALRGKDIYVSVASGLPGRYETPDLADYSRRVVIGGSMEAAANACTHRLQSRLRDLKIPATFEFEPRGTHAWIYWENQLPKAWPTLARSLGLA
ncbi:alpha/beta hydrolase family protein [Rhodococcus maanshanensis]|uniref:alpha/beta hydrolase n=1 Tax=Rhodococcus maanshanensis TaxID=183556 RepID=UPI0022B339DF|nr:alpha/beta hydrolase family protein [Rhodococcus maanshanensis]MCZ4556801.1 alpha/beta hydrolase family protein [Rhodococcus maanshanensis]